MKILAFVDTHANVLAMRELERKARDADLLICAGDVSVFGSELVESLDAINSWNKPCLLIHGNHEDESEMETLVRARSNLHWIHALDANVAGLSIVGWGGGGFARSDSALEAFAKTLAPHPNRILVFHGPPSDTAIDVSTWMGHVGCRTRRAVIEELKPLVAIAGHMHECFGKTSKIGKTVVMNPGPLGVVIELGTKGTGEKTKPNPGKRAESAAKKTARGKGK